MKPGLQPSAAQASAVEAHSDHSMARSTSSTQRDGTSRDPTPPEDVSALHTETGAPRAAGTRPGPTIVILPTYNEANNLPDLAKGIIGSGAVDALLVVDDNSPDGTGKIADALAAENPRISVHHRPGKLGLGTAYRAGFEQACARGFERIITMDADFSHDPCYLDDLVTATREHDLAIGSRYIPGAGTVDWGLMRKIISGTANVVAINSLALPARDCTSGYRCYRRSLLEDIDFRSIRSDGYSFLVEALFRCVHRATASITEIPIIFRDRRHDVSKISKKEIAKSVATILRLGVGERLLRRHRT